MEKVENTQVCSYPNYTEECIFHATLVEGKALQEMVEFFNICLEVVVFFISSKGFSMKADNRPPGNTNAVETIYVDLHIPANGFCHWHITSDLESLNNNNTDSSSNENAVVNVIPIPINVGSLCSAIKGSILAPDAIILYVKKDDPHHLWIRVQKPDAAAIKMQTCITLIKEDKLPPAALQPPTAPVFDMSKPTVTFQAKSLGDACKDAKKAKTATLKVDVHKNGIMIHFSNNQFKKEYPQGLTNSNDKLYTAIFKVPKVFDALVKCMKLNKTLSVYARERKPMLFSIGIKSTNGRLNIYMVPESETH